MSEPTIIVAGLGRCGTTLVMRMLAAGGVPTIGTAPDWESPENVRLLEDDPIAWAHAIDGKAVKLLDAHRHQLPDLSDFRLIWLQRDAREQAKSMLRLLGTMFSTIQIDRKSIRAMQSGIQRDTPLALRAIGLAGSHRSIAMPFERILNQPLLSAHVLCDFLDIPANRALIMASQVMKRSPAARTVPMEAGYV